jgi:hypothetical protein
MPSPSSATITSGLACASRLKMPFRGGDGHAGVGARDADVVERERGDGAGIQHRQRVAHERDAGELGRADSESGSR